MTLEIFDAADKLVRPFSSDDKPEPIEPELNVPTYWIRPPSIPAATAGMHRFVWDLSFPAAEAGADARVSDRGHLSRHAALSAGTLVLPGAYSVKLTVDGKTYTQPLTVKMDPRVKTPLTGLQQQFRLAQRIVDLMHLAPKLNRELAGLLALVEGADSAPTPAMVSALDEIQRKK